MVSIAASSKLHAFNLAEQMERKKALDNLFTTYAYSKNTIARNFVKRIDKEEIPKEKIKTFILLAAPIRLFPRYAHIWNEIFDRWTAAQLKRSDSKVFIGWSGMSLKSMRQAKKRGMKTILERGSSHILFQNNILKEEYKKFGKNFSIHPSVIQYELDEYAEADFIEVPTYFAKNSFVEQGIPETKIMVNPFGANKFFKLEPADSQAEGKKFRILYMGTISVQKGLVYLFRALNQLSIPENQFEVWFIGGIDKEMEPLIKKYKKDNWTLFGHINYYELKKYLVQCDVGIQPSLQEGLSMVIPQMMSCGVVPVFTINTGADIIVEDNISGYAIPIRDPDKIAEKIEILYSDRERLNRMKAASLLAISTGFTWDDYGDRYMNNILKII
jgi:glycosyltransferase involved in cell wall biosynthesis